MGSGALGAEAELGGSEITRSLDTVPQGSGVPGRKAEMAKAEVWATQQTASGDPGAVGVEAGGSRATELLGDWEAEAGTTGVSGPWEEVLRPQQTESMVSEVDTLGVQMEETAAWGAPITQQDVSRCLEAVTEGLGGQEDKVQSLGVPRAEAGLVGVSEANWGGPQAEMGLPGPGEDQPAVFEAQEAKVTVTGRSEEPAAEGGLPGARVTRVQGAGGAGAGVARPLGAPSPEGPEEDRRLPGSQVGLGAAEGRSAGSHHPGAERTAALHAPTWGPSFLELLDPSSVGMPCCLSSSSPQGRGVHGAGHPILIVWTDFVQCGCW